MGANQGENAFRGTFTHTNSQALLHANEFSTPNCNDISMYHLGNQIGHGAYAVVKESIHKLSGEKVAIKQYDRSKL